MSLEFKLQQGVVFVAGSLDDRVDYSPLLRLPSPVKLNLGGVNAMNSHGIRSWIKFLTDLGTKVFELYECPPVFLDAVNLVPQIASPSGRSDTIKSVSMPYNCGNCARVSSYELAIKDVVVKGETVKVPGKPCKTCKAPLGPEIDPEDLFLFLTMPD